MVRKTKRYSVSFPKKASRAGWYQIRGFFTFRKPETREQAKGEGWSFLFKVGKRFKRAIRYKNKRGKWCKRYKWYRYYSYKDGKTRTKKRTTKWKKLQKELRHQAEISGKTEAQASGWITTRARYSFMKWTRRRKREKKHRNS